MPAFRYFLCCLSLWLLAGAGTAPAQAQVAPPAGAEIRLARPVLSDSAAEVAHVDTAIAVQRLFLSWRRYGRSQLILGGIEVGAISLLVLPRSPSTVYQYVSTGLFVAAGGFYGYQLVRGLVALRRFRPGREQLVLESYDNNQPLPRWVRRRLKAKYFSVKVTTS